MVEPQQRIEAPDLRSLALLPVHPPEVDPLILQGMVQQFKVVLDIALVGDTKGDRLTALCIDIHGLGKLWIDRLEGLYPLGRVQVEAHPEALVVDPLQEGGRVGEQFAVPGVAGPAIGCVPVHIDDQHIQWHVVRLELAHQCFQILVSVGPVTGPPGAQHIAGHQGHRPAKPDIVGQSALVIVAVAKEIPVLHLVVGAGCHPAVEGVKEH